MKESRSDEGGSDASRNSNQLAGRKIIYMLSKRKDSSNIDLVWNLRHFVHSRSLLPANQRGLEFSTVQPVAFSGNEKVEKTFSLTHLPSLRPVTGIE